ncbi:MAG: hypothetical protein U1E59_17925 [Amaricoccus sp.]
MTDKISFSNLQLKTGITPTTAPNALGLNDLGTTTGTTNRVLAAIVGDGDKALESGEAGFVIGGAGSSNAVANLATLDTSADPVTITLHGRTSASAVGTLDATALGFNNAWGFGIDNGPDGNNRLLNAGDALTFTTNAVNGVAQQVAAISFTVDRNGATTATELAFDFDGDVLKTGSYAATANAANADTALRLANVAANAVVAIDFLNHHLTVDGAEQTGASIDAFFAAYERSPKNVLTIGSITSNGFSVRDLVIDRAAYDGPAPNAAPTVSLSPVRAVIADTADLTGGVLVANIVITDDSAGRNDLSLTGDDAAMFEIRGNGLYLKAGTALHAASNPTLDVSVVVDDRTVGSTPDSTAAFSMAVTGSAADRISFADVQLKTGVTPLTAPNALTTADLGTTTGVANRALVAITGNGDKAITNGETGYVIGGAASGNDVPNLATLDTAADPVTISMHGRTSAGAVGALAATALDFNNTWGFGIDNGPDANGRLLNAGDALTFTTNPVGGVAQQVGAISFVVDRNGATGTTEIALDFDGDVLKTGSYAASANAANADAALRLANVAANAVIAIDFLGHHLTVNGAERTGTDIDAFFAAFESSPKNAVTIGSITSNGFSVRDLVIDRTAYTGPAANAAPSVSLVAVHDSIADTADVSAPTLVANIVITDDGVGRNDVSLAGADAGMFQIIGDGLYLKAGVALHAASKAAFDVSVQVDDKTVGSTPDGTAGFHLGVTAAAGNHISFANLQLKTGVTPATAPNGLTAADLGTTTAAANRVLAAITGNGDKALSNGETGYVIGGAGSSNAVTSLATLDTDADPVAISLHGRTSAAAVGALDATALGFTNSWGFGIDNGPDANNRLLNAGDALTFALNPVGGVAQQLTAISFAVDRNGATTATEVDLDFDGNVLKTGSYAANANAANANAALRLTGVPANAVITIDFLGHHLSINGTEQTGANIDAFFAAYEASPRNVVTIGSIAADGFSVRDLVIDRATPSLPVGPVADTDSAANTVAENAAAGTVVGITAHATDPNAADAVSYTVSDGRFHVDANGVVTVAQGAAFDAETEQAITLHVTAKSTDGSSSVADFIVQVGDVNEFATGPVGDTDTAANTVATTAANGTAVGITAFAQDHDRTTNTITYSLDGAAGAFGIDAVTGKVTVVDATQLTEGSHDITVRATSADTSFSTQTFTVNVASTNNAPTGVTLTPTGALPEDTVVSASLKVADITVVDPDGLGANTLSLTGADAANFEIVAGEHGPELHLRAGTALDFETKAHFDVRVEVDDANVGTSPDAGSDFRLDITDANEAPTSVALAGTVAGIDETPATTATKVADIVVADDALGGNAVTLGGADAAAFEVVTNAGGGKELWLRAGQALHWETKSSLDVTVTVADAGLPGSTPVTTALVLPVNHLAPHYGSIVLDGNLGEWTASTRLDTETAGAPGFIVRGTYEGGAFIVGIESTDGTKIGAGTTIWFNTDLNAASGYQVWGSAVGAEFNINFDADGHARLYAGATPDMGGVFVADLDYGISADGHGLEVALPSGLVGNAHLADMVLDVNDGIFIPGNYWGPNFRIGENQPPSVSLNPVVTNLRENADVSHDIKVADIAVSDTDGLGSWTLSLSGANSGLFTIVDGAGGPALYLKAGADLDFEKHQHLDVTVNVDDPSIGAPGVVENHADFSLAIGDVNESQGPVTLDGALGEWLPASRLDSAGNGQSGYALYGTYATDTGAFVLGLKTDGTAITETTQIWLNTDLDRSTGYKIFGFAGGAEYKIGFAADGTPSLYALGADGSTSLVSSNLDWFYNPAHSTLEIALPSTLVGGSHGMGVYVQVNGGVANLPNDYANIEYIVKEKPPLLPEDPTTRIAIVYSETSANAYFSKTAYDQLFMAAQYQAMQAGVPFDILTEDQLKDFNNLVSNGKVKYDAIVFPDFANVKSADLQAITDTLTTAVRDYHIGLVAAGNFMTNTETGAAIVGDAYARMKSLLGVTRVDGGATSGVVVHAGDGSHPVNHDFAAGSVVGNYTGSTAYDSFGDVTGSGKTLFTQTVAGAEKAAVIATTATGANSVHFATDAIFGNNNILQHAIDWAAHGDTPDVPDVGLELTRGSSLFFSRTDLDQSQEYSDVVEANPGIYSALLPILQQWYQQYDFVGSYYANIGANPPDNQTDWTVSKPFYQALVAMENELGTHSYTHPEDTNYLLNDSFTAADRTAWLAHLSTTVSAATKLQLNAMTLQATQTRMTQLLAAVDPATHNNAIALVNALSDVDREILKGSYKFQFEYSKEILSQQLGIAIGGGAVPGAPEQATTSAAIMQYLDYISGGYSGVGAGYPGAFGFIDPDHQSKAYFAPNVPFDFSLVEFQHMTAAQAAASWAATYQSIIASGETPIIHFPWHDYGPLDWDTTGASGAGHGPGYTTAMFTDFIARAYADGTEFVTGADLAQRILTFVHSGIEVTRAGDQVIAHVTGSGLGKFALDVDTDKVIASVDNWYAYDGKKVFLPTGGGTFAINLGNQAADVTHIAKLPMRAELLTVSGDGSDLAYAVNGRGDVVVDVKSGGGIIARGADAATLSGTDLTLTHGAVGAHAGSVDWVNGTTALVGTDGDDFLFGSAAGTRVDGGRGHDAMTGGGGADTFVFAVGDSDDTVRDFTVGQDRIELVGSSFSSTTAALGAFTDTAKGAMIALSATDHLTLSNITVAQLTTDHLILGSLV